YRVRPKMYPKNLHNTTGISPAKISRQSYLHFFLEYFTKGSRSSIAAFLLLAAFTFMGCDSPGSVGEEIISGSDGVTAESLFPENFTVLDQNTFSGRLPNTALGHIDDPVYGKITSTALIKPGLSRAIVDTIREDDSVYLKLIFQSEVYGNRNSVSNFTIYEANEIWRGNQLRYNLEVDVNFARQIGAFEVSDEDTVLVELEDMWLQEYISFFNSAEANRDSLYRNTFKGLAIVPSESNQKIRFLRHLAQEQGGAITSILVESPEQPDDNGDGDGDEENGENGNDEEEEEEQLRFIDLRDWGASFTRSVFTTDENVLTVHNTENVVKFLPDLPVDRLSSRNIVNARLILSKDTRAESMYPAILRPRANQLRAHLFTSEPADLPGEIFTRDARFVSVIEEDEDTFSIDITEYILDEIFGDSPGRALYLTIQSVNGIIYSTTFYDQNGPENKRPRLVITSVR
ncbi:MAG: DUF4270 family protein, partial [Balneolaceae bacterium]